MRIIAIVSLICLLPLTALGNGSARRVGSALIKLMEHLKYTDGTWESQCIASSKHALHEDCIKEVTFPISDEHTEKVYINPVNSKEAFVSIHSLIQEDDKTRLATVCYTARNLEDGSISHEIANGSSYDFKTIQVHLSNESNQ